jgi:HD-GYP domain-containing protein (c-di-GMP phosphodiesterase class II)
MVLCDSNLQKFDPPSAIAVLKEANIDIPLIIISGSVGEDTAAEYMRAGAKDFITKGNLSRLCPAVNRELKDADVSKKQKQAEVKLQQTVDNLRKAIGTTIHVLVSALESRDTYTAGHQSRSADIARAIATAMGLDHDTIEGVRMAGSLYDVGKLAVPAQILNKPTPLTKIEVSMIKEHARKGYEMLKELESPWPLAEIVYQHHERMNGSGYPRNLKGDEILMEARILAVSDVLESMSSPRPYRKALGIEVALEEIEKNKGFLYDQTVADTCLKLFRERN